VGKRNERGRARTASAEKICASLRPREGRSSSVGKIKVLDFPRLREYPNKTRGAAQRLASLRVAAKTLLRAHSPIIAVRCAVLLVAATQRDNALVQRVFKSSDRAPAHRGTPVNCRSVGTNRAGLPGAEARRHAIAPLHLGASWCPPPHPWNCSRSLEAGSSSCSRSLRGRAFEQAAGS